MSIGAIIFIIGVIYSIYEWIKEENDKKKKQATFQNPIEKYNEKYQRQQVKIEQIKKFEKRVNKNVKRIENVGKSILKDAEEVKEKNSKQLVKVAPKTEPIVTRQASKPIQKRQMTLNEKIDQIQADPHLSERQKINRIQSLMMNAEIDEAQFNLDMSKQSLINGMILSEVLSKPKSLR